MYVQKGSFPFLQMGYFLTVATHTYSAYQCNTAQLLPVLCAGGQDAVQLECCPAVCA